MSAMARTLWIFGLTIALVVFGAFVVFCIIGLVTRHHLNSKGWIVLFGGAYTFWITLQYLRLKIAERHDPRTEISN
jgi:hypothetical protein